MSSTDALKYLWRNSLLGQHPKSKPALDQETGRLDVDVLDLDGWAWSSGERVLVKIAMTIASNSAGPRIGELWLLDPEQRAAASQALVIWWRR